MSLSNFLNWTTRKVIKWSCMFFEKVSNGLLHIVDKHPNKNSDSPFIKEEGEEVYFQSCEGKM